MTTIEQLQERLDSIEQSLAETISEHRAEAAAFGDSWPGAQLDIRRLELHARDLRRQIREHPDYRPHCCICDCLSTGMLYGMPVCDHHRIHGEGSPEVTCPTCNVPAPWDPDSPCDDDIPF